MSHGARTPDEQARTLTLPDLATHASGPCLGQALPPGRLRLGATVFRIARHPEGGALLRYVHAPPAMGGGAAGEADAAGAAGAAGAVVREVRAQRVIYAAPLFTAAHVLSPTLTPAEGMPHRARTPD
eukprot:scaffold56777_cov64-Phaeocystis_antarctica.AAC.13